MTGRLSGKTVAIIVANEYEDIELLYPLLRLSEEGAQILVCALVLGIHPRPYFEGKPVTGRVPTAIYHYDADDSQMSTAGIQPVRPNASP